MKIRNFIKLSSIVLLVFSFVAIAEVDNSVSFNVNSAYSELNAVHSALSFKSLQMSKLKALVTTLGKLNNNAQICVDSAGKRLNEINNLLTSVQKLSDKKAFQSSRQYQELQTKKEQYAKQVADCQLFVFRSHETITEVQERIQQLGLYSILKKSPPIWDLVLQSHKFVAVSLNWYNVYNLSGLRLFSLSNIIGLGIILLLCAGLGLFIRRRCSQWLGVRTSRKEVAIIIVATIRSYILPLLVFTGISIYLSSIFFGLGPNPSIELISYFVLGYLVLLMVSSFILCPHKPATASFLHDSHEIGRSFFRRLNLLGILLLIFLSVVVLLREQEIPSDVIYLALTVSYIIFSFNVVWICWLFSRMKFFENKKIMTGVIRYGLMIFLFAMIVVQLMGYYRLAVHLILGIFFTFIACGLLWLVSKIVYGIESIFNSNQYPLSKAVRDILGVKFRKRVNEFVFIKIVMYFVAISIFVLVLLYIWGFSLNSIDNLQNTLVNGFSVARLTFVPYKIMLAFLVFALILIFRRFVATYIARHYQFAGEKDTQVAMASIVNYALFGVGLIVSLVIAGINFTGLAVIAGALSVGIGLGLQGIVNNFVSGVILLIEKPIKPGDRVVIDGIEGFVKRVRTRSTQITTLAKEDIIIPNADLMTNKVTNFMFRDNLGRVVCEVGVAYGSNIELVKKTLLQVASEHPEVIKVEPNQPVVLFREFGDSSLKFFLYCIVENTNNRYLIHSDLNFAINKAFKKHKITIAYPQIDVHMDK